MADTTDLRKGFKLVIDRQPYIVVESQFVKPGKGQAFFRTKMKNMMTGSTLERTYKSGEKLDKADTEERTMQYLYPEGDVRVFMDTTNYEQIRLSNEQLGDNVYYLLDGTEVDVMFFEGKPIGVTPPTFVELEVVSTEPGFKGDTSSNTTKPAELETGMVVNVPLFVNQGDRLKIDTRTGEYVERAKG
ncbi:MAG: elongation factor P [Myxococcales bacterium]|nr:elongation factor P [Myxococcales bacterium]MCA9601706.1 elongation factor P [Myxococcales bacterium]